MVQLFVYGTLQDPEVLAALLGAEPPLRPLCLDGWRVAPLADRVYPGLVRDPGATAAGHLLAVDPATRAMLDDFEDVLYDRVEVALPDEASPVQAWVLGPDWRDLARPGTWSLEDFQRSADHPGYVANARAWARARR